MATWPDRHLTSHSQQSGYSPGVPCQSGPVVESATSVERILVEYFESPWPPGPIKIHKHESLGLNAIS